MVWVQTTDEVEGSCLRWWAGSIEVASSSVITLFPTPGHLTQLLVASFLRTFLCISGEVLHWRSWVSVFVVACNIIIGHFQTGSRIRTNALFTSGYVPNAEFIMVRFIDRDSQCYSWLDEVWSPVVYLIHPTRSTFLWPFKTGPEWSTLSSKVEESGEPNKK